MIIKYVITGHIQLEGEDLQEAVRNLTPLALQNYGEIQEVIFSVDDKTFETRWAMIKPIGGKA